MILSRISQYKEQIKEEQNVAVEEDQATFDRKSLNEHASGSTEGKSRSATTITTVTEAEVLYEDEI